jgi:zinc transport system permease protein
VSLATAFSYPPILKGFLVLILAGCFFPLSGVFVLKLQLVPLRFTLMHGTLLGGAAALALGLDPLLISLAINLVIVFAIAPVSRFSGLSTGYITAFFMVLTIGLAYVIIYKAGVPAKDTLEILWGNIFALSYLDVILAAAFCVASLLFVVFFFQKLKAMLFSREIAFSVGINEKALFRAILILVGLTVAFSLKLIGALLLDSLLLLPAIAASFFARSVRSLFLLAGLIGLAASFGGFLVALNLDIPASSAVTIVAALLFAAGLAFRRKVHA